MMDLYNLVDDYEHGVSLVMQKRSVMKITPVCNCAANNADLGYLV